jgi:hypothetical protein
VSFTFTGTLANIGLTRVGGTNSADLIIDGGEPTVISNVAGTNISTPRLSHGTHTVVLRRRSEPAFGSIFVGDITTDGSLGEDVALKRQIEVIGDSISVRPPARTPPLSKTTRRPTPRWRLKRSAQTTTLWPGAARAWFATSSA